MPKSVVEIDKSLTHRIHEYMSLGDDALSNPHEIADALQTDYPKDYKRRKKTDFQNIVTKIYRVVLFIFLFEIV